MLEICTTDSLSGTLGILFSALRHQHWVSQEGSVCAMTCCGFLLPPTPPTAPRPSHFGISKRLARMQLLCCCTRVSNCTIMDFLDSRCTHTHTHTHATIWRHTEQGHSTSFKRPSVCTCCLTLMYSCLPVLLCMDS